MYWHVFKFAKQVLLNPSKALKKTIKVKEAAKYITVLSIVSAILTPIIYWFLPVLASLTGYERLLSLTGILFIPVFIILAVLGSLINAGLIHAFGKLFKILPKNFDHTYTAIVYSETPAMLFGWIPVVGVLMSIWGLVLKVMGLKRQHGLSTGRAILAIFLPYLVIVPIAIAIGAALAVWLTRFI